MEHIRITEAIKDKIYFQGRILWKEDRAVLGYTNSSFTIHFKGTKLAAHFETADNDITNAPGLRIYLDDKAVKEEVLMGTEQEVMLYESEQAEEHTLRVVKITEAGMSYVEFPVLELEGELLPVPEDTRTKALFIGDSITCGYGVLGEPDSEYTIREEDGEMSYAGLLAKSMDWNAEWVSVSGHGMFVEYTGDPENILPREFPYTYWFIDKETREDYSRFQPDVIIMNLGTNDSGPLAENPMILAGFRSRYESFLYTLRIAFPKAKLVCVLGTLAPGVFQYVQEAIDRAKSSGLTEVYGLELPYHDVEHDGMASGHPSPVTHQKDARRIEDFIRNVVMKD